MKRPSTCVNLIKAINAIANGGDPVRLSRAIANVIVGQLLPDGVVKGGSSLMFHYGGECTRYTRDIDTACKMELDEYISRLEESLAKGWNGFTGKLVEVEAPKPKAVPPVYVMIPFDIKLSYCGRPWQTIRIEVGHNEIGDADTSEECLPAELAEVFDKLSFPRPNPLPVMDLAYQIAQKLHAVSEPGSERAHDLIDLQLINNYSRLDLADVREKCVRLFNYRCAQVWPPKVTTGESWNEVYDGALATMRDKSAILANVEDAVAWVNDFISRIENVIRQ